MSKNENEQIVIVTGDIAMDWNLARTRRTRNDATYWSAEDITNTTWQRGGAALLADLVEAIARHLQKSEAPGFSIRQTGTPRDSSQVQAENTQFHHSYAMWSLCKYGIQPPQDREKEAWRVEEFLGLNPASSKDIQAWQKVVEDSAEAGLVVLDDAALGFRENENLWPIALKTRGEARPWILLKMAKPLAEGRLWEHLRQNFADRLIVVATVDDLRLSEVQVSRELSWERTAQDVYWELLHNPCVKGLSLCAHVIISFGPAGAILLSRAADQEQPSFQADLFFDPKVIERMWEKEHPGGMVGYTTCLAAALARQWMLCPDHPDIPAGIQNGISAMRTLHLQGYGERGTLASKVRLVFPIERIADALDHPAEHFAVAKIQDPMRFIQQKGTPEEKPLAEGFWTILQDKFNRSLDQVAEQIVKEGPEAALKDVPWGIFHNLRTVDRQEIESYRSIRNLVGEYKGQKDLMSPLSIAVFGTPGSGKSFGVTEMAVSLLPGEIEPITFNLSQFDSPENLWAAMHQVRDIGLKGKLPLVFWDEFDTSLQGKPLGWLRYFLAPMQDGKFQDGQISHPTGRAIFVFAGGTSSSMAEFDKGTDEKFKEAKGPDFVSRLKGYINVLGPNPVKSRAEDPYYIIRRAILLNVSLKHSAANLFEKPDGKEKLHIDEGVLRALLKIGQYKHGARSIQSILAMSQLTNKTSFERSCLPSESQLDLHVNGKVFLSLVQEVVMNGQTLESLAEAAHEAYCEGMKERGYKYGPIKSDELKTRPALVSYSDLPEHLKESNRRNVRDIPAKLAVAGYIMIPARSNERPFNFPEGSLEELAEAEHERWMQSLFDDGWAYAPITDEPNKKHECLVPWKELPDSEKKKDIDLVRGIPAILAKAGYAIVKVND
ncbi:MAG TPA: RyR domain-containing protein [Anaerolineales bacterium]|nr:RyR domain-containing protein [Anaerolineales bacterium]